MGVRLAIVSVSRPEERTGGSPTRGPDASPVGATGGAAASGIDESWSFTLTRIVLGRSPSADVVLPHPTVSSRHASIEIDGAHPTLVDHDSLNGTWVNGQRLAPGRKKSLRDGDRIDVGLFALRFFANAHGAEDAPRDHTAIVAKRLLVASRVELPRADQRVVLLNGDQAGRAFVLPAAPARLVLGRGDDVDIPLHDADASRAHAELSIELDGTVLRDLGSKNGVFVGEERCQERRLVDRDELRIGRTRLVFEAPEEPSLRALEAMPDEACSPPVLPSEAEVEASASTDGDGASSPSSPTSSTSSTSTPPPAELPATPEALAQMMASEAGMLAADPGEREAGGTSRASSIRPPSTPSRAPSRANIGAGEWMVYVLAVLVVVLSAAALLWLLG